MRALALLFLATAAHAQTGDWTALEPALGVAASGGFGPEWSAGPTGTARVEAPAYGGHARVAFRVSAYAPQDESLPEFLAVAASLGWGPGAEVGGVAVRGGLQAGVLHLRFDDDGLFGGNLQNETELAVGVWARVESTTPVRVWAEATVERVAFARAETIGVVGGGLAVRLRTPRWLVGVLR